MSALKKYKWHKIAESSNELFNNHQLLTEIIVAGKTICLARFNSRIFACTSKCPHAGGFLVEGHLDALGNIICPLHRYKFSLQNGRNISGEGYYLKTFPIEEREDGIYIGFEEAGLFGLFR